MFRQQMTTKNQVLGNRMDSCELSNAMFAEKCVTHASVASTVNTTIILQIACAKNILHLLLMFSSQEINQHSLFGHLLIVSRQKTEELPAKSFESRKNVSRSATTPASRAKSTQQFGGKNTRHKRSIRGCSSRSGSGKKCCKSLAYSVH